MNFIIAYLSGIAASVILALCAGFLFGSLTKIGALLSLSIGLIVFFFIVINYKNLSYGFQFQKFSAWSWFMLILFLLLCLRAFLWVVYKKGDDLSVLCANNLGDIPYHIAYIKYFANGVSFWPDNLIFTGEKINYHFGMDLFNSLLVLLGADLIKSLIWVGILGSFSTAFALLVWGRTFTLTGFLFTGGLAGFQFLHSFVFSDYQSSFEWKNIFLAMFIPQRGFLFALPAGLLLLSSWKNRLFNDSNEYPRFSLPFWIEVLLYSSLPLFNIHTFVFLSLLLLIWFVFYQNIRLKLIYLVCSSFIPFFLFLLLVTGFFKKTSMIHIDLSYLKGFLPFVQYWFFNYGIFWPLVILLSIRLIKLSKNVNDKLPFAFVFPAIFLFVIFSFVMFTSWSYDNAKLLMWSYIILLPFLWDFVISEYGTLLRYFICFLLFFSGFVCVIGGVHTSGGYGVFKLSELYEVSSAVSKISIEYRFAAFPTYNHPLLYCGRKLVMGYPGWVWSHGINARDVEQKLNKLMLGDENWKTLAKDLGVRYIFWGRLEKEHYPVSLKPWEKSSNLVNSGFYGEIFDLGEKSL